MSPRRGTARGAAHVLLACGLLAIGYAAFVIVDAQVYQTIEHWRLEGTRLRGTVAPALVEGSTVGEIRIPRLGLTAIVAQGDSPDTLRRAVGHLADTPLPGQFGNVVLAGHRDTFFRPLKRIRAGDAIALRTWDGDFEYLVVSIGVVRPTDIEVLEPTAVRTLTLITCFPFSFVGSAPDRFIVRAREVNGPR